MKDNLDALAVFVAAVLTAIGGFLWQRARAHALSVKTKAEAHVHHAAADRAELAARGNLDADTRRWANLLIENHDTENAELRAEMKQMLLDCKAEREALEERHRREMDEREARYQAQLARVEAELNTLRQENWALRLFLVRNGFEIGTGPLPELGELERIVAPKPKRSHL